MMISKLYIDKLKRMGPKRTVAAGANDDGSHPVPLDYSLMREDMQTLIEYKARLVWICSVDVLAQVMDIFVGLGRFTQPEVTRIDEEDCLTLRVWHPTLMFITLVAGENLNCEYWLVKAKASQFEDIIDLNLVEYRPIHRIGVTSDA
jgi:hypothetical protein